LWLLFSAAAFLIHVWALVLIFRDLSWVAERNNMWDAIGVGAYGLMIAIVESFLVFLVTALLGLLVSMKWDQTHRVSFMGTLIFIVLLWAIMGQLYFLLEYSFPPSWIQALASTAHPIRILYVISILLVTPTVLLPAYGQLNSAKLNQFTYEFFDRISLLVILYLVIDFISLIIVIIRNL
jgi:hypothetical protein